MVRRPIFGMICLLGLAGSMSVADERPNVILVMADDMGYECLSSNGCLEYRTPHLDALGARGIRFQHCYSLPICTPSRVKIMTGRYSFRNYERFGLLPTTEVTFGSLLQKAGYSTAIVGKWQLGGDWRTPTQFGFDEYCLQNGIAPERPFDRSTRGPSRYWGHPAIVANGELYESKHTYGPDMLNEYAVNFIRKKKDRPFFLYYPMLLPHSPFEPSPRTPGEEHKDGRTSEVRYFKDMVEYTDHLVGNLVKALEDSGQRENTLIMFTGDNGTTYPVKVTASCEDMRRMAATSGRVGTVVEAGTPSPKSTHKKFKFVEGPITRTTYGDVPGGKDLMANSGTRVPLVVDWPKYGAAYKQFGNTCTDLIDFSDFFATVLELAGAEKPVERAIDGISFASRLQGRGASTRDYIFCHYWGFGRKPDQARDAIHDGTWKLYNDGRFFNVVEDMDEQTALAAEKLAGAGKHAYDRLSNAYTELRGLALPVPVAPSAKLPEPKANATSAAPQIKLRAADPVPTVLPDARPNVVIIYSDDQGWGDVGYHGFEDIMTPRIDKLAAGGTWFSQAYVSASVCGPSRAGLLTGIYQQRMGVYGNYDKGGIPTSQPSLFEMLKREGYNCGAVGKWHVGAAREELRPNSRCVDFFYGFLWGAHDYYKSGTDPDTPRKGERPIMRNTQIEPPIQASNGYLTEMFTKEAVQFIERTEADKPFCLYLAYNAVHHPWSVPDSYVERVQHLDTHDERKLFAGMVLAMDDGVGAVMDALRRKGVEDNTLVFFMSDNGSPRGQGIAQPKQKTRGTTTMSSPGPFNGFKGDTYEGGTRVPFVMYWPGKIPAGAVYKHPVINLDIVPTVLARCSVRRPYKGHAFDGVDLLPFITGRAAAARKPHDTLYWRRGDDYALLKGDWKLAWNDQGGPRTIQLFNLANDPGEWRDLAAVAPERAQVLQDMFDAWDSRLPDNQGGRNPRNRNTGYASGRRVDVEAFNARQAAQPPAQAKPAGRGRSQSRTFKKHMARKREQEKKTGKPVDQAQEDRWFRAKDLNSDGVLDENELSKKVRADWNRQK